MTAKRCSFLFRTAGNLFALREADNMLIDGTFKSAPSLFTQMLGINRVFNERWHLPLSCGLLPGNSQVLCTDLFENLNDLAHIDPQSIHLDHEIGMQNACSTVWPSSAPQGCYFHLTKALFNTLSTWG